MECQIISGIPISWPSHGAVGGVISRMCIQSIRIDVDSQMAAQGPVPGFDLVIISAYAKVGSKVICIVITGVEYSRLEVTLIDDHRRCRVGGNIDHTIIVGGGRYRSLSLEIGLSRGDGI